MYLGKRINNQIADLSAALLLGGVWGLPVHAQIEPTDRCNLKCVMCPRTRINITKQREFHDLSLDNFIRIIDQIPTLKTLQLSGWGEPLLNMEFASMVDYAHRKGIEVATNSNGTCFTVKNIGEIIDSGLDFLKVSIDSPIPHKYQKIRHIDLEVMKQGVKLFVQQMIDKGAKKPRLSLNVILMKDNIYELDQFFDFANDVGICFVRFKPLNIMDMGIKSFRLNNMPQDEILNRAKEKADRYGIQNNLEEIDNLTKNVFVYGTTGNSIIPKYFIPCYLLWHECFIGAAGDVRPCCNFYTNKYSMGNVFEKPFSQVWNGHKYHNFRKKTARGFMPVECNTCNRFYPNYDIFERIKSLKRKMYPFGRIIKTEFS